MSQNPSFMLCVFALSVGTAVSSAQFEKFTTKFDRHYNSPADRASAMAAFENNARVVKAHNAKNLTWTLSIMTPFADLTAEQFRSMYLKQQIETRSSKVTPTLPRVDVDWVSKGVICPVRNQGMSGGQDFLLNTSIDALCKISGKVSDLKCGVAGCKTSGVEQVPTKNEAALQTALQKQPVLVAVEADQSVFQLYQSGVVDSDSCGTQVDHQLLLVGYGTSKDGTQYYTAQNRYSVQ